MKRPAILPIIIATLALLTGCAHNDGDIGPLYGWWHLDTLTTARANDPATGAPGDIEHTEYPDSIFWAFQSGIIEMERLLPHHSVDRRWGTWTRGNGRLMLDFTHSDPANPPGTGRFEPLPELHLPSNTLIDLKIEQLTDHDMVVSYADPAATTLYIYYFSKW